MHHLCASTVGFVSAFTTHGSRYYSPFFYGVSELSSIPLSLVNIYKFRPDWHVNMPILQHLLKGLFALTFLTIRVGCWMPVIKSFFSDIYHLQTTSDPAMTLGFRLTLLITSAIPALLLTCLQLFWAYRIVQIVWRILLKQLTQKVKRIWRKLISSSSFHTRKLIWFVKSQDDSVLCLQNITCWIWKSF